MERNWVRFAVFVCGSLMFGVALSGCSDTNDDGLYGCGEDPWIREASGELRTIAAESGPDVALNPDGGLACPTLDPFGQVSYFFERGDVTSEQSSREQQSRAHAAFASNGWRKLEGAATGCFEKQVADLRTLGWSSMAGVGNAAVYATTQTDTAICAYPSE